MHEIAATPFPTELRASVPPEMRGLRRDHVRLLVVDPDTRSIQHSRFDHLGDYLRVGDLLVVNTSRTLAAAVPATRSDGNIVQIRPCVRRVDTWDVLAVETAPPFRNIELRVGERLLIGGAMVATVRGRRPDIPLLWRLEVTGDGLEEMAGAGLPIRYSYVTRPIPLDYYQTVYAGRPGSAEMPSAGRPLSWELLRSLRRSGVEIADLLLHTGLSSYQDDDFDAEHHLFEEWYEVPQATAAAVNKAPRTIAVGTTVVRTLETAVAVVPAHAPYVEGGSGWTTLRLGPGSRLRAVDGIITGLHEPQATHFELLGSFLDEDLLARAFDEAVEQRYLFHEFGDSMLVLGSQH